MPESINSSMTSESPPIPGPTGHFLFGSIREFQRDQLAFVQQAARTYGPVARIRLANVIFNLVSHPDGVRRVLQENYHNYIKGEFFDPMRQMIGKGIFASEGPHWLRQRRLMQPVFHRQRIAGFADAMVKQTEKMFSPWEQHARSAAPVDISQEFNELTMRIIAETMFSTQLGADTSRIAAAMTHLLDDLSFRFLVPFYPRIGFPTPRNIRAQRELGVVDEIFYRKLHERRHEQQPYNDLFQMLIDAQDEETGEKMSDQDLRDEVITLFVAGQESTALLLTWFFHNLATYPEWDKRLFEEVHTVLNGRSPGIEDLPNLPLVRMAVDETLRLYPPLWITNRTVIEDDELCGLRIRAGEVAGISPFVTHRLPEFWPDPERFDPLRFLPEAAAERPRFAYFPFSGGPRICIGNNFALVEAQLIVATLVQRFRLTVVADRPVRIKPLATLRPDEGLWLRIENRSG